MFTSENVLCAELINEKTIKVTHKEGDNVLVTTIQKNPRKESYKSLIDSGWTLKKIKEKTKELQKIENPDVRRVEEIAGGYSWALDQLKDKRNQINTSREEIETLCEEIKSLREDIEALYKEKNTVVEETKEIWKDHKEAWEHHNKAIKELVAIYEEYERSQEHEYKNNVLAMKQKFQENYDKYQDLYGLNVTDFLFDEQNLDKEMLFKVKLECLSREELKQKDKSFKTKIRKAKTMYELIKLIVNEVKK